MPRSGVFPIKPVSSVSFLAAEASPWCFDALVNNSDISGASYLDSSRSTTIKLSTLGSSDLQFHSPQSECWPSGRPVRLRQPECRSLSECQSPPQEGRCLAQPSKPSPERTGGSRVKHHEHPGQGGGLRRA